MALQPPFFGKRDTETNNLRRPVTMAQPNNPHGTHAVPAPSQAQAPTASPVAPDGPSPVAGQRQGGGTVPEGGSKLTVGPNIDETVKKYKHDPKALLLEILALPQGNSARAADNLAEISAGDRVGQALSAGFAFHAALKDLGHPMVG